MLRFHSSNSHDRTTNRTPFVRSPTNLSDFLSSRLYRFALLTHQTHVLRFSSPPQAPSKRYTHRLPHITRAHSFPTLSFDTTHGLSSLPSISTTHSLTNIFYLAHKRRPLTSLLFILIPALSHICPLILATQLHISRPIRNSYPAPCPSRPTYLCLLSASTDTLARHFSCSVSCCSTRIFRLN